MKKWFNRPSPSMVVATIALLLAMGGAAFAGSKIGSGKIKPNAIKTAKIKNGAVTSAKLAKGAVTAANLAPDAIPAGSEVFSASHSPTVLLPPGADTVAIQTTLPTGNFVFTVTGEFGSASPNDTSIGCTLLDGSNPAAQGRLLTTATGTIQETLSLTGVSDGGAVSLSCNPNPGGIARNLTLTAVKAGSITQLDSTP